MNGRRITLALLALALTAMPRARRDACVSRASQPAARGRPPAARGAAASATLGDHEESRRLQRRADDEARADESQLRHAPAAARDRGATEPPALRREILAGPSADQSQVSTALDRVLRIQRERTDLQIEEQRAFAEFMTPVQRAKYAALQEQLRRRAEKLRGQRAGTDSTLGADDLR